MLLLQVSQVRNENFVAALCKPFGNSNQVETVFACRVDAVNDQDGRRGLFSTVNVDRNSVVCDGLSINRTFPRIQRVGIAEYLSGKKEDQEEPAEHEEPYKRKNSEQDLSAVRINKTLSLWDMSRANASPIGRSQ